MKRSKKGFTLAELLVVVAIIAILVAVSIPIFAAQREKAEKATCDANRRALKAEMGNAYLQEKHSSMSEAFNTIYTAKKTEYVCPKKGTYTWEASDSDSGYIKCSVHDGGGNGGGDSNTLPGTDVPVVKSYWPNETMYGDDPLQIYRVDAGGIFKFKDTYYVITGPLTTITKNVAINGPDSCGEIDKPHITKITGKVTEAKKDDYRLEGATRGDIYHASDGNYYVFMGGWNQVPPEYKGTWYKLP